MKAAVWHARNDVRVEEIPEPGAPGPGEVILKVGACGICGTDLEEYRAGPLFIQVGTPNPLTGGMAPVVLGHEFAGEVVEVGREVTGLRSGDLVSPEVIIACGQCYFCQRHLLSLCENMAILGFSDHGGLAEYCRVPAANCVRLPYGLAVETGALAEPLSVAVRAGRKGRLRLGETVAIFGGGTIGLLCLQVARAAGASAVVVVEPHAGRRALASRLGADEVIDPATTDVTAHLRALTGVGPDLVIQATGAPEANPAAVEAARKAGRIVIVGLPVGPSSFNFMAIVATEKEVIGSLAHIYDEDYAAAIRLLGEGRVQVAPLISDRIPLADVLTRGLHRLETQAADTLKILVTPHG
jgi:(R,R)-butanediol dehydrogenase/meso-butanediol dehydrogenase/diacetyl reductase